MKNYIFILALFITIFSHAQNEEVQRTIETFFEGFHQKDSLKMKSVCAENLLLQSISEGKKGTKLVSEKPVAFYKSIASIPV